MGILEASGLLLFISTFFFVSITPGMCMTLALTLGMSVGVRRTLWMMLGEVLGVGLVALAAVLGVAAFMLQYPTAFQAFKYAGGAYLAYLGVQMWRSGGRLVPLEQDGDATRQVSRRQLWVQGFVTAVANPKGWAFCIALLPPFISQEQPLLPQLALMLVIIVILETLCMLIYASGGRTLSRLLHKGENVRLINRIAGTLMLGVGLWLALS